MVEVDNITALLQAWRAGDSSAIERVTTLLYDQFRRLAAYYLQRERGGHTLQATALAHEVYLRLGSVRELDWQTRAHFMSVVASLMRQILIDHARKRHALKRATQLNWEPPSPQRWSELDVLAVHEALERLERESPRLARVVELRYFGGLDLEEVAQVLEVSTRTVERDWKFARARLSAVMSQ